MARMNCLKVMVPFHMSNPKIYLPLVNKKMKTKEKLKRTN